MKKVLGISLMFTSALSLLWACTTEVTRTGFGSQNTGGDVDAGGPGDLFGNEDGGAATREVTITGTTYAPKQSLKLANTLVYVTDGDPAPIPDNAYCDKCITIPQGAFVFSQADGSFSLTTRLPMGAHNLVVQKGQFRRIRKIVVGEKDTIVVPTDDSTLPSKTNVAQGDTIPKMLLVEGNTHYDHIEASLAKLGIDDIDIQTDRAVTADADALKKYHVVFLPCSDEDDPRAEETANRAGLRNFVEAGGKLYVTDYAYEWVRQPFGGYVSWKGESSTLGSAAGIDGEYDGPGKAQDPGLRDWLAKVGAGSLTLVGNWTKIEGVNTLPGLDENGMQAPLTPKVWMTVTDPSDAIERPATVSFQQGCGRVLFSSYHTEGDIGGTTASDPLLDQEKALLYVLLEVTACAGQVGPPK